jgi:hypothetical protein
MGQRFLFLTFVAGFSLLPLGVWAEIGPCRGDANDTFFCGTGEGAARIIRETISPSKRFALGWRLTDRPPTERPGEGDPNLESLIVRIDDGAVLAKSRGFYWELANSQAKGEYVRAAWSPDSHLLIKTTGRRGVSDAAELFALAQDDSIVGPFDLGKVLDNAVLIQMRGIKGANRYSFHFSYAPAVTVDNQGLIRASVFTEVSDSADGPIYKLIAQITRTGNSLDAKVVSISRYKGPYISVTVQ